MAKLLFFPFYLVFKMIELPFKFVCWCLKASIKLTLAFMGAIFIFIVIMMIL